MTVVSRFGGKMKVRYSQGGRRLGTTARHKLISVDCVVWENVNGLEVSNSYSGMSFYKQLSLA